MQREKKKIMEGSVLKQPISFPSFDCAKKYRVVQRRSFGSTLDALITCLIRLTTATFYYYYFISPNSACIFFSCSLYFPRQPILHMQVTT